MQCRELNFEILIISLKVLKDEKIYIFTRLENRKICELRNLMIDMKVSGVVFCCSTAFNLFLVQNKRTIPPSAHFLCMQKFSGV